MRPVINYIDLGVHRGDEIDLLLNQYEPYVNEYDLNIYGIEANTNISELLIQKYSNINYIQIFNYAVTDKDNIETNLFLPIESRTLLGSSIYQSKVNVTDSYIKVTSITLSTFIRQYIQNFDSSINILKLNIEGAELLVYQDLIKNNLKNKFSIFCGHPSHDIEKIPELESVKEEYYSIVKDFNLQFFCAEDSITQCINIFDTLKNIS